DAVAEARRARRRHSPPVDRLQRDQLHRYQRARNARTVVARVEPAGRARAPVGRQRTGAGPADRDELREDAVRQDFLHGRRGDAGTRVDRMSLYRCSRSAIYPPSRYRDGGTMTYPGHWAKVTPEKPALINAATGATVTYKQLNDTSNRLAQLMYAQGLRRGDHIAIFMENHARFFDVTWAALRSGLYMTTVNRYLTTD